MKILTHPKCILKVNFFCNNYNLPPAVLEVCRRGCYILLLIPFDLNEIAVYNKK